MSGLSHVGEDGVDGSIWIEPSDGDRSDRARWSDTCPE